MRRGVAVTGLAFVAMAGLALVAPLVQGGQVSVADREGSYPPGVANVTHSPWAPRAGDDVKVVLTLESDARVPQAVSLLYCRVEPEYVCGLPLFMEPDDDARRWRGTIEWGHGDESERFIKDDTRHVGYNVTMRFEGGDGRTERVSAPTGNYWVPDTYPEDSEGVYYFLRYDPGQSQAIPLLPYGLTAGVGLLALAAARRAARG